MYNPVIQECLMLVSKPMHMYFCRMDFKTLEKEIRLRKDGNFSTERSSSILYLLFLDH